MNTRLVLLATLLLSACAPHDTVESSDTPPDDGDISETSLLLDTGEDTAVLSDTAAVDTTSPDITPDTTAPLLLLSGPTHLALPFISTGEAAPALTFTLEEIGGAASVGSIEVDISGPFALDGILLPLDALEPRSLTVRFTRDTATPGLFDGLLTLTVDDTRLDITLAAAIGDPALPRDLVWSETPYGRYIIAPMPSAPFPDGSAVYDDNSVLIFVPRGFDPRAGLHTVTHIHGHRGRLGSVISNHNPMIQTAASGRNVVLIAPQGPEEAADSDLGKLDQQDGLAHLLRDSLTLLYRDGAIDRAALGDVLLTAHSGGYLGVANMLERGGVTIAGVHLFDALYARESTYRAFANGGGVLRSNYTSGGGTLNNNAALRSQLESDGFTVSDDASDAALDAESLTIVFNPASHRDCVIEQRAFARYLRASGIPRSPGAPPELLLAHLVEGEAELTWRSDSPTRYTIEGSNDGQSYETLATDIEGHSARVPAHPWLRVVAVSPTGDRSASSDVYGATGNAWLVVDGFDRFLRGSWSELTHPFAARLGAALGAGFSVASNEAVATGLVSLTDYAGVLWMLGDESRLDVTFDASERAAIEAFVANGGHLIVTGSEVGYATDSAWLQTTLGASYVADDAGTTQLDSGVSFGDAYEEDFPDVLSGDTVLWRYDTGGGAAVGTGQQILVVGFPLETLEDASLAPALNELTTWLMP